MAPSKETRERMERARERDRQESGRRESEKKQSDALSDIDEQIAAAERRVRMYTRPYRPSSERLSPQSEARGRANWSANRKEAETELADLRAQRDRVQRGESREAPTTTTTQPEDDEPAPFDPADSVAKPSPYYSTPSAEEANQARRGGFSPIVTGDPQTDALMGSVGGLPGGVPSGGGNALDSIIFGLEPTAAVFEAPGERRWANRLEDYRTPDTTNTVGALFTDFFTFEGEQLRDLQYDLYIGGFFGDVDPQQIAWGVAGDESTNSAWQQAVVRAARFYAAGKKLTVDDVLKVASTAAGGMGPSGSGGSGGGTLVQLTDPASLGDTIDNAAKKVLGRKASAEEKRLFVAAMHDAERKRDVAVSGYSNPASTAADAMAMRDGTYTPDTAPASVEVSGVSPEARAEEFARSIDPTKADARKVVSYAGMLSQMLKGQV